MELPEELPMESKAPSVIVEPHEIVKVDNPELPTMTDIDVRLIEGEKQLDEFIGKGMGMFQELYEETNELDPQKRNRHMEVTSMVMGTTLDAIKHKTELQLKKKGVRMKEQEFQGGGKKGDGGITANFFGSREELLKFYKETKEAEAGNGEPE